VDSGSRYSRPSKLVEASVSSARNESKSVRSDSCRNRLGLSQESQLCDHVNTGSIAGYVIDEMSPRVRGDLPNPDPSIEWGLGEWV